MGNKGKIINQIKPYIPDEIDNFFDVFGGSGVVGINSGASHVYYNDTNTPVYSLLKYFKDVSFSVCIDSINKLYEEYNLPSVKGYYALRDAYNTSADKSDIMLYTLITLGFNYEIRFNKKGGYNIPYGDGISKLSDKLVQKLKLFIERLDEINISFYNNDYITFLNNIVSEITPKSFVYLDPPYLGASAVYNKTWGVAEEAELWGIIDTLVNNNVKFMLSNDLATNINLEAFANSRNLNIIHLNREYANCVYTRKKFRTDEVIIFNYKMGTILDKT